MSDEPGVNRRDFVRTAIGAGAVAGLARSVAAAQSSAASRSIAGANGRIHIGVIGVGGRGDSLLRQIVQMGEERGDLQVTAVCDV